MKREKGELEPIVKMPPPPSKKYTVPFYLKKFHYRFFFIRSFPLYPPSVYPFLLHSPVFELETVLYLRVNNDPGSLRGKTMYRIIETLNGLLVREKLKIEEPLSYS